MEDLTRIDDNSVVFKREGTYQARIRVDGKYVYRSLKTGDLAAAIKAAEKLVYKFEFNAQHGIPNSAKTFGDMLRDYVQWRRDYYTQRPNEATKRNVKVNPTDKTLQFDLMIAKAVIKWAHEQGWRGLLPLPLFTYTPKKKRVRPAFENGDYRVVLNAIAEWIDACDNPKHLHTRQLLLDYVVVLARSGMRVGEANNLKVRDVHKFYDRFDRVNYRFVVRGKTGARDVIPAASVVSHVERVLAGKGEKPDPNAWFFSMANGSQIISLADQFAKVLDLAHRKTNSVGDGFSLYSLRHYYAVMALRDGIGIYDVARNMGTSVEMIQQYYGKQATPKLMATTLGGRLKDTHKLKES